jgi:hypothetical protein
MAKKSKPTTDPPKPAEPLLQIVANPDEPQGRAMARTLLCPSVTGGSALYRIERRELGNHSALTLGSLTKELAHQCNQVSKGDLSRPEAMLTAQAHTLDALFSDLTRLAYNNLNNFDVAERLLRLAYRAQSQARATVETLGVLKNPPMVFAKQANIANGPQQVNNDGPRARDELPGQNKLLEQTHGERLEPGTASGTGRCNTKLETVGAFNRAANSGR